MVTRQWQPLLALPVFGLLLLSGCAPATMQTQDGVQQIAVELRDYQFQPSSLSIKTMTPVQVNLKNGGSVPHTLAIEGLHTEPAPRLAPGETGALEFTATEAGSFKVVCTEPGHAPSGMVGEVVAFGR